MSLSLKEKQDFLKDCLEKMLDGVEKSIPAVQHYVTNTDIPHGSNIHVLKGSDLHRNLVKGAGYSKKRNSADADYIVYAPDKLATNLFDFMYTLKSMSFSKQEFNKSIDSSTNKLKEGTALCSDIMKTNYKFFFYNTKTDYKKLYENAQFNHPISAYKLFNNNYSYSSKVTGNYTGINGFSISNIPQRMGYGIDFYSAFCNDGEVDQKGSPVFNNASYKYQIDQIRNSIPNILNFKDEDYIDFLLYVKDRTNISNNLVLLYCGSYTELLSSYRTPRNKKLEDIETIIKVSDYFYLIDFIKAVNDNPHAKLVTKFDLLKSGGPTKVLNEETLVKLRKLINSNPEMAGKLMDGFSVKDDGSLFNMLKVFAEQCRNAHSYDATIKDKALIFLGNGKIYNQFILPSTSSNLYHIYLETEVGDADFKNDYSAVSPGDIESKDLIRSFEAIKIILEKYLKVGSGVRNELQKGVSPLVVEDFKSYINNYKYLERIEIENLEISIKN